MTGYTNLYLYKNTKFYKHMSYKIDDINSFLATLQLDKLTFENLQYFRPDSLQKELKIPFNQKGIKSLHQYNYARIVIFNTDQTQERELFYFVDKIEWLSSDCIRLRMTCDTLNSFLDDLEFHPKTFIEREHCDRWNYDSYINNTSTHEITLLRNIPELNEGLNPQKYSYYLGLESGNYNIRTLTSIEKRMEINTLGTDQETSWIISYLGIQDESAGVDDSPLIAIANKDSPYSPTGVYIKYNDDVSQMSISTNLLRSSSDNQKILVVPYAPHEELIDLSPYTQANPFQQTSDGLFNGYKHKYTNVERYLWGFHFSQYKKWNSKSPNVRVSRYINGINFDTMISNLFIVKKVYNPLRTNIVDNGFFKFNEYSNESAMYSSEFLQLKFYYLDNDYTIGLEDYHYNGGKTLGELLDVNNNPNGFISIHYSISLLIDNSIYFKFGTNQGAFDIDYKVENGQLMITPINTQIPIINSDYLNYMRNGYNYDIKIRDVGREYRGHMRDVENISAPWSFLNTNPLKTIRSIVPTIAEFGGKNFTEDYTQMMEDLQMEKNISQLKGSKLGIEQINGGIDKANETTTKTKLGLVIMCPRKSWWKYLEDYFYFYGNKVQYYGIPTHNNRCLFDYLKCRAEFVNRNNVPNEEALQDIIQRLGSGVTFIHKYLNQWIFDSDYKENVENRLLEIIQGE